eukprot:2433400-Pyramimonas_sp.AAC.1
MSGPTAGNIPAEGLCLLRVEFEREYEGHTLQKVLKEEAKGDFEKALSSLASYTPPPGVKTLRVTLTGAGMLSRPFRFWLAWGIFRTMTPPIGSRGEYSAP